MFTDSEPTQPCDIITAQPSELTTVAGTSMETETVVEIPAESLNLVVHIHSEDDEVPPDRDTNHNQQNVSGARIATLVP